MQTPKLTFLKGSSLYRIVSCLWIPLTQANSRIGSCLRLRGDLGVGVKTEDLRERVFGGGIRGEERIWPKEVRQGRVAKLVRGW